MHKGRQILQCAFVANDYTVILIQWHNPVFPKYFIYLRLSLELTQSEGNQATCRFFKYNDEIHVPTLTEMFNLLLQKLLK